MKGDKQQIFIFGSGGRLGAALVKAWQLLPHKVIIGLSHREFDFENSEKCLETLKNFSLTPYDFLINCAAITNVDRCEEEPSLAMKVNATTPGLLAQFAAHVGARFLQVSTDYVFDGIERFYQETDQPNPISHYGVTKLAGEKAVLAASPNHYVTRVSWVFGPDRPSFVDQILDRALTSDHVAAIDDKTSSPSYTKDLAEWLQIFLKPQTPGGVYHLCNSGICSWREYGEYALQVAARAGLPLRTSSVSPLKLSEMKNFIAKRPKHSSLDTTKFSNLYGQPLRSWQEAVEDHVKMMAIHQKPNFFEI